MNTITQAKAYQDAAINHHRASGWQIISSKQAKVIFAYKVIAGRPHLKAWRGSASKTAFYYCFRDESRAQSYGAQFIQQVHESETRASNRAAEKKAKRAKLKASDFWSVGDVAYTSWGYDQTNVEWFQIVRVLPRSVVVRQVKSNSSDHGQPGGGRTAPRRYEYIGPEISCPLSEDGSFTAGPCHNKEKPIFRHHCSKWEGRSKYTSSDR